MTCHFQLLGIAQSSWICNVVIVFWLFVVYTHCEDKRSERSILTAIFYSYLLDNVAEVVHFNWISRTKNTLPCSA